MQPTNLTNISGAFSVAIPDFANSDSTVANIIIFLTDGQATTGITSTPGILQHIQDQITLNEVTNLSIHTFGIGDDVNQQLLSQIASQNNGLCQFLENEELLTAITEFYNMIRNPVLLNPQMTIDPAIIVEAYPSPLPNLYLGQQLVMTGRYAAADSVTVVFSGDAFGIYQEYTYGINLADTNLSQYQFLTKLWAKQKMENLYILYFTYDPTSPEAEEIKNEIIDISICYNVISPFTSYTGGGTVFIEEGGMAASDPEDAWCTVFPNPFTSHTTFRLDVRDNSGQPVLIRIYDNTGKQLIILRLEVNGHGTYEISWDGRDAAGIPVGKGIYFYTVTIGGSVYSGKISRL
jgi:Ca-activated chloride channel family protein